MQITVESDLKVDYKFHDDTRALIDTRNSHEARLAAISTTISQSKSVNTPDLGKHYYLFIAGFLKCNIINWALSLGLHFLVTLLLLHDGCIICTLNVQE